MFSNDRQLYVTPDTDSTLGTLFLVYTAFGAGHYDAALPCYKHPITQIPQAPPSSSHYAVAVVSILIAREENLAYHCPTLLHTADVANNCSLARPYVTVKIVQIRME